ncbi:MoaD/ThiS family protein [Solwaraspora sp. WMMD937]|uniref:MoaD/ThiS family protein n=1 Tax=Solwaraspora sp. WMMD937 TaxID=3016090 RepID=UPI00249ABF0D|nr:MoaD/ThiS family protein [Solwaraspora sp. WMMD937]WFE20059.1 MoaD/ThiS family protein [Solwaraspora sp. WMMD937]
MAVFVEIPTVFQSYTNGVKKVSATGSTVGEVLVDLDNRYRGIRARVIGDDGALRRFVNIYVNDEDVRGFDLLDTEVTDGDSILILPAVAGG